MSDVVWWSDTGKVLHKDPNCPAFVWVRAAAIRAMDRGDYARGVRIRSYDFAESNCVAEPYPPEHMQLCRRCG